MYPANQSSARLKKGLTVGGSPLYGETELVVVEVAGCTDICSGCGVVTLGGGDWRGNTGLVLSSTEEDFSADVLLLLLSEPAHFAGGSGSSSADLAVWFDLET